MNLETLTAQEIADIVTARLRDGTGCAMSDDGDGTCSYRTESGHRCAVGVFLPDDSSLFWVSGDVGTLRREANEAQEQIVYDFLEKHESLLLDLQSVHDIPDHWSFPLKGKKIKETRFNNEGESILRETLKNHGLIYRKK